MNPDFDLSEACSFYFKSSFARAFDLEAQKRSKSLDCSRVNRENFQESGPHSISFQQIPDVWGPDPPSRNELAKSGQEETKEDYLEQMKRERSRAETKALQEEYERLVEENRQLQAHLLEVNVKDTLIENSLLKEQVEALRWQLKQTEASRQMYHEVLEQVERFLDRGFQQEPQSTPDFSRVPRARSVHAVDLSPARNWKVSNAQLTWRRRPEAEGEAPEQVWRRARRLLRTVRCLLQTPWPRLCDSRPLAAPPSIGSCSSLRATPDAEDESGFSSMGSFQDVGLPLANSSAFQEVGLPGADDRRWSAGPLAVLWV